MELHEVNSHLCNDSNRSEMTARGIRRRADREGGGEEKGIIRPEMIGADRIRRVVSSVEYIEQTCWMINALGQILSAHEVCRVAVTPPPLSAAAFAVAVAVARDALGRAIRTRLITCICNCSNVTRRVINRATNPSTGPTDRPVEFRSTLLLATLAPAVNDLLERRCRNYGTPWEEGHVREFPAELWRALSSLSRARERKGG